MPIKPFIAISGIIGVGKSTLTKRLGEELGFQVFKEPVEENPYLEKFYGDMSRWAFTMQIFLLGARFKQHQEVVWGQNPAIQDRSIYEDTIFAEMLWKSGDMSTLDYQTYLDMFMSMTRFLQRPDAIYYLDVQPEEALRRIKLRARGAETKITVEYLTALRNGYESFYNNLKDTLNIKKIDWNNFGSVDLIKKDIQLLSEGTHIRNRWGSHL